MVYELDEIIVDAEAKGDKKTVAKLNSLKETLVITTGDNYVGSAEPQLRERMADLYSKVASSYDKPSSAELNNLKVISSRFDKAKSDFDKIKNKYLKKKELQFKSFEEFVWKQIGLCHNQHKRATLMWLFLFISSLKTK